VVDGLDVIVRERDSSTMPGVAVGLIADGEREFATDGLIDLDNPLPVTPKALFQLGSVTKTFTATAAMALVDRGEFALNGRVGDLLPNVDLGNLAERLTIEHLLTHCGGWQGDWALFNAPPSPDTTALAELVGRVSDVPRVAPPGGPFSYDNLGWCVLGAVIEACLGTPFDIALGELVLRPLELEDTLFREEDVALRRLCAGHTLNADGNGAVVATGTEPWADHWPCRRALWPTGGIVSTLTDMVEWAEFHLTGRSVKSDVLVPLSNESRLSMRLPRVESGGQGRKAALGWHIRFASGQTILSHTGAAQGFSSHIALVPDRSSAMVALTNSASGSVFASRVFSWFLEDVLDMRIDQPRLTGPIGNPAEVEGNYHSVSRSVRLVEATATTITAEITDSGPTWHESSRRILRFAEGDRLIGTDGDNVSMEFGSLDDGRKWVRYRGRIHLVDEV
jgi:CubicO group peptidase (beta-lactamase class C family)